MRLFEAIIEANHRALAGDANAGLHPADFADELPLIALTCIDPRLNPLMPGALALPEDQFIWLRNAGNIITGPLSSTMKSLALACAVKGGKEIAIIGHSDCLVAKTSTAQLIDRLRSLGVERHLLPDNINEFFGIFANERQNVHRVAGIVRHSPLIGPRIPVHGLLIDINSGKLEWLVNGYQTLETAGSHSQDVAKSAGQSVDALNSLGEFKMGEMKFPETKIGEIVTQGANWLSEESPSQPIGAQRPPAPAEPASAVPLRIPMPPPLRPRIHLGKSRGRG